MKSPACFRPWTAALALAVLLSPLGAEEKKGTSYRLEGQPTSSRRPLEERRVPAFQRIEHGLTPYVYEGKVMQRHDEVSSNVMSVHVLASGGKTARLRAGHSLAPHVDRITRR
jgi:hypothetical protein